MNKSVVKLIACIFAVASLLVMCDYHFKGKRLKDILTKQLQNYKRKGER